MSAVGQGNSRLIGVSRCLSEICELIETSKVAFMEVFLSSSISFTERKSLEDFLEVESRKSHPIFGLGSVSLWAIDSSNGRIPYA